MDRELRDLRQGYVNEQRRLVPDPDPAAAPRDDECVRCPECNERHTTLVDEIETELDRYCNACLRDALIDRMGAGPASRYIDRAEREARGDGQ